MALRSGSKPSEPLEFPAALDLAYALLGQRPHLEAELSRKLQRRGAEAELIATVLERLRAGGLVDDEQVARRFAEETAKRRRWGAQRVRADLQRRGAEAGVITAALADLDAPLPLAREAAARWLRRRGGRPLTPADRPRLARHLTTLGHPPHAVREVLEESDFGSRDSAAEEFQD